MNWRKRLILRYYLFDENGVLWRIPNELHTNLVRGKASIPRFAETNQKVLEAFLAKTRSRFSVMRARGTIYKFSAQGTLDLQPYAEAFVTLLEGSQRQKHSKVLDIVPRIRSRKWIKDQKWDPPRRLILAIENSLQNDEKGGRIRMLRC